MGKRTGMSKGDNQWMQGHTENASNTFETEGQMLQRVMPDLVVRLLKDDRTSVRSK